MVMHIRDGSEKDIIVIGSYRGSSIIRLFLKRTAETVINETNGILFFMHH